MTLTVQDVLDLDVVVAGGPEVRSSDGIRVLDQQPCLDIREQLLA